MRFRRFEIRYTGGMAFTVSDFEDLLALLTAHPDWRARLRPVILGPDFEEVPSRLDRIEAILTTLAEQQAEAQQRLAGVERRLAGVEQRQASAEQRLDRIEAILATLAQRQAGVERRLDQHDGRMGNIEGGLLEARYSRNLDNWLGDFLRRPARVAVPSLDGLNAALTSGAITFEERRRLRDIDMVVVGQDPANRDVELYLTCEFSSTVNMEDLARAEEHAEVLRRCGYNAKGFAGGYMAAPGVDQAAQRLGVILDLHRPPD